MEKPHPSAVRAVASPLPDALLSRLGIFADLFTRPSWENALWLLAGAVLAPGRRTVSAVLRILGRDQDGDFVTFHRVLHRARWSSRLAACRLLHLLVAAFVPPSAAIVIGLDDTIERRWGAKINARGIYRDPVRSSKGHFVKTSGLRWLSAMLLVRVPWAGRIMALPFLTVLAPSERFYAERPRAPKTLTDWARQAILQIHRWLPGRAIVVVADSAFAAVELLAAVCGHVSVVTRLRLDANLFAPAPPKKPARGRPPVHGRQLPKLKSLLDDPDTVWQRHTVPLWYSQINRTIEFTSGLALWYRSGITPVPIRWVLVRDPDGVLEPQAFLCTNTEAEPANILGWFIMRWQVEVTFEETRAHLGVETQRQWSDLAILRTTPALFGLFSIVCLWAHDINAATALIPRTAAWYRKPVPTFSDAIAAVRRQIWAHQNTCMSRQGRDCVQIPREIWDRMADALAHAA
jgi:hypothetical protein